MCEKKVSLILLAGGEGTRMGENVPKQFLPLAGRPVIHHSLEVFRCIPAIAEVIVVCAPAYRSLLTPFSVRFALPGPRRQDSLAQGFAQATLPWICVHDAARPFPTQEQIEALLEAGYAEGAATLATPVRATLKRCDKGWVTATLDREGIWEIQTPQFLSRALLSAGLAYATDHGLTVTDDVSLAELLGHPVKIVPSTGRNFKLTYREDYACAQAWCRR